jgi:hypothetical protein
MSEPTSIEFVNDWSELEAAVADLAELISAHAECEPDYCDTPFIRDYQVIVDYVPRLLTQYANLVELSFALTEGWEQYATLQKPTGLYLPDHR